MASDTVFLKKQVDSLALPLDHRRLLHSENVECNNTLPRGGMYWKIRPLKQFAPRGPRDCRGVQIAEGSVFSNPSQLEAVYCHSFLQSRGVLEINLQIILAVYKFNTLPLYKKECLFTIFLSYPTATDILLNNFKSIYLFVTLEY